MAFNKNKVLLGRVSKRSAPMLKRELGGESDGGAKLSFVFISRDNAGERWDWDRGGVYVEKLDPAGAKFDRLTTFLKDHNDRVDNAIGRIENTRLENGELIGDVVFGKDQDSRGIYEKYVDGILTDVSVRYRINAYEVEERRDGPDIVTVTDYDIFEVSAVTIGFDGGAIKRNKNEGETNMPEELKARLMELEKMRELSKEQEQELVKLRSKYNEELEKERAKAAGNEKELTRRSEIQEIAIARGISADVVEPFISDSEKTVADFLRHLLDLQGKKAQVVYSGGKTEERQVEIRSQISDAIAARMGAKVNLADNAFAGASLLDMARAVTQYNGYDRNELVKRAMVTTDFPLLLIESGNRVLTQEWEAQEVTYRRFVTETDLNDFKKNKDITRGAAGGRLDKLSENGELKERRFVEHGEEWKLSSYGNKFVLTRQMLVNDDLGAFNDMLSDLVFLAGNTANGLVYDMLRRTGEFSGYVMADGKPVFDATAHKNFLDLDFSSDGLSKGRLAMRKQLGVDGKTPLNIAPRYLVVAPELEDVAMTLLNSRSATEDNKNEGVINPYYKSLELIVDAELAAPDEWYMLAARRTIKVGYLAGTGRRPILQMNTQSLMRTEFEGVFDFGVLPEDYRGMVKGK